MAVTNGVVPNSNTYAFTVQLGVGAYYFWAVYSGDASNEGTTSACGVERFTIANS